MAAEYQESDWRVVDYEAFCLDPDIIDPSRGYALRIRGPRPANLERGNYFVCLGAAQTFGRFCPCPFPTLLQQRLSLPVLNISHGGAGPSYFVRQNGRLLDYLNNARFVVLQVMSARSEGNSLFECEGVGSYLRRSDGMRLGCDQAYEELIRTEPREVVERIVHETRENWLASYQSLLSEITSPSILFWFSTRRPNYRQAWDRVSDLFGEFPQLVDGAMVKALRMECDAFVSCVSRRGRPQILRDRTTGEPVAVSDPWTAHPWEKNWYYPSPEMHVDAAKALERACRKISAPPLPPRRRHSFWRSAFFRNHLAAAPPPGSRLP